MKGMMMSLENTTLRSILRYVGGDLKYAEYAQLESELESYAKEKYESGAYSVSTNYPNESRTAVEIDQADHIATLTDENARLEKLCTEFVGEETEWQETNGQVRLENAEAENTRLEAELKDEKTQHIYQRDHAHMFKEAAEQLEAEIASLREVVEMIIEWSDKYPSSRIYGHDQIVKIAAEIDKVAEIARSILAKPAEQKGGGWKCDGCNQWFAPGTNNFGNKCNLCGKCAGDKDVIRKLIAAAEQAEQAGQVYTESMIIKHPTPSLSKLAEAERRIEHQKGGDHETN